jgi:tetratricopeptide (TPR) repeat protein
MKSRAEYIAKYYPHLFYGLHEAGMDYYWSFASHFPSYQGSFDLFIRKRRAIKYLQKAAEIEPENEELLYYLGSAYHFAKQYKKTVKVLSKAIELYPDACPCYTMRGWAYSLSGEYEKAIADYTKAGEWDTSYHWCYFRGQAHFRYKHYREAIEDFSLVLQHQHYWAAQVYWRARAYKKLGEYDKAIDDYTALMGDEYFIIKGSKEYMLRGEAYQMKGDKINAEKDFAIARKLKEEERMKSEKWKEEERESIQIEPDQLMNAKSYTDYDNAYCESEQTKKALKYYNKAISIAPNDADGYITRAACYNELGKLDEAISDYTHALAIDDSLYEAYYRRAELYTLFCEYDKAVADFSRSLELNPRFIDARNERKNIYYMRAEFDKAIEDETQLLKIYEYHTDDYASFKSGPHHIKPQNEIKRITDAINRNPCNASAHFYQGKRFCDEKKYD